MHPNPVRFLREPKLRMRREAVAPVSNSDLKKETPGRRCFPDRPHTARRQVISTGGLARQITKSKNHAPPRSRDEDRTLEANADCGDMWRRRAGCSDVSLFWGLKAEATPRFFVDCEKGRDFPSSIFLTETGAESSNVGCGRRRRDCVCSDLRFAKWQKAKCPSKQTITMTKNCGLRARVVPTTRQFSSGQHGHSAQVSCSAAQLVETVARERVVLSNW